MAAAGTAAAAGALGDGLSTRGSDAGAGAASVAGSVGSESMTSSRMFGSPGSSVSGMVTPQRNTLKRKRGTKASPRTPGSRKSPGSRYDSSLGLLTKKFTQLIQTSRNGIIDLNLAATALGVQKRRIYDITNVMEGINLIEKKSKNNIQWKGTGGASTVESQRDLERLRLDLDRLRKQDADLTSCLDSMSMVLKEMTSNHGDSGLAFITHEDARSLACFRDNTVIAVKAPPGTTLEVPDPDEGQAEGQRRYEIYLNSDKGPIEVFLVSQVAYAQSDEPGRVASPAPRPASPHLAIGSAAGLAEEMAVRAGAAGGAAVYSRNYVHERSAYHRQGDPVPQQATGGALGSAPAGGVGARGGAGAGGGVKSEPRGAGSIDPIAFGGAPDGSGAAHAIPELDSAFTRGLPQGLASDQELASFAPSGPMGSPLRGMSDWSLAADADLQGRRELGGLLPLYPEVQLEDELPAFAVQLPPDTGISDMFDEGLYGSDLGLDGSPLGSLDGMLPGKPSPLQEESGGRKRGRPSPGAARASQPTEPKRARQRKAAAGAVGSPAKAKPSRGKATGSGLRRRR